MKKFIPLFLLSAVLSGCAVVQQAQLNSGVQKAQEAMALCGIYAHLSPKEAQEWMKSNDEGAMEQCFSGLPEPWPKDKVIEASECGADYLNRNIKPYTYSKTNFKKYMDARAKSYAAYAAGKISFSSLRQETKQRAEQYIDAGKSGSYYTMSQCRNEALQRYVMPSYPHKGLLMSFMSEQSEIGLKVDEGKMSPKQGDIAVQKSFASLLQGEQQENVLQQQQSARAWQQGFENMQRIEQNNRNNMPKQTNCNVFGSQMNCTTW